ncbi:AIM24 family protein [Paenibacillus aurantius]|uniref:AIM24 family protein n=1 Tax=Paenibacillus aurantius TaxID=2918900 RepID=A0AA96LAK3_9BACL|nr:AIM24 family protein [Paenibacillus aurantius]WNQ09708.1 AIM24 family protein [Paenibacillus aurantius]
MEINYNEKRGASRPNGAHFSLAEGERLHVLHPKSIVAFQGVPANREDRLLDLRGMYRKRKWIRADLTGPAHFLIALPTGYSLQTIPVDEGDDFLYDMRNVLFYSHGIEMKPVFLKIKNMLITRDIVRMKFTGSGTIGLLSHGPLHEMALEPTIPLYVDTGSLVAYPHNAELDLSVYGNHLASQHMNYQWKITGRGRVLLQSNKADRQVEEARDDGFVRRLLREALPFGGVFIK